MVGYLLVMPAAFVLAPLAGLLALSAPRTVREWAWMLFAGIWSGVWLVQHGSQAAQVVRAAAVLLTGAYVVLTLWRPVPGWRRAVLAVVLAGAALDLLMGRAGIAWSALRPEVTRQLHVFGQLAPVVYRVQTLAAVKLASPERAALIFPALLAVLGTVGTRLAWTWHCCLAERPIGERFCSGERNL